MKNSKRILYLVLGFIFGILALCLGIYIGSTGLVSGLVSNSRTSKELRKIRETIRLIDQHYVDSVSNSDLLEDVIPSIFRNLDPHSVYLSPDENRDELQRLSGQMYGIGIVFNTLLDTAIVIRTEENGPADLAGIKAGDRIIQANNVNISSKSIPTDSIIALLKGPKGTKVDLKIFRPSEANEFMVSVTRDAIKVPTVSTSFLLNDSLAYLQIKEFGSKTYEEFMQACYSLIKEGAKAFVIDLRNNGGGLVFPSIRMANEFLKKNDLIVYRKGRAYPQENTFADGAGILKDYPLYVLINPYSASASELFSGAIQDNDRGIIIGRRSFGKGLVQKPFQYKDGSSVRITISRYYTPSGRCVQRKYTRGNERSYAEDFYRRSMSGEWFSKDSIHPDEHQVYYTTGGRKIYGGGGIIPDVFISIDTVGVTSYYREVVSKGLVAKFAFQYADNNRVQLGGLDARKELLPYLQSQGLLYKFAYFAARNGVPRKNYLLYTSRNLLLERIIGQIVSYIKDDSESQKIYSLNDWDIQEALKLYEMGLISPFQIKDYTPSPILSYDFYQTKVTSEQDASDEVDDLSKDSDMD